MSINLFSRLSLVLIIYLLMGCKHDSENIVVPVKPTPRFRIGEPVGPQTTFTVTSAGGEFSTPDQSIKLIIPAGAVSKATQISMQPVENTAPAGTGQSIRLLPHNIQFERPVTIQFAYANQENIPENSVGLGIAFQDETGTWRFAAKPAVNETTKTISVTTTHFSDWVLAHYYKLIPVKTSVMAGEQAELQVVSYLTDDMLGPITAPSSDQLMGQPIPLELQFIKNQGKGSAWTLGGAGKLAANGSKAVYKAPNAITKLTTVNVLVELEQPDRTNPGKHWLISSITIVPAGGTVYRINGGAWEFAESASVIKMFQNVHTITSPHPEKEFYFTLSWQGGLGTHPWNAETDPKPEHANMFQLVDHQVAVTSWWYDEQEGYLNSEGGIVVSDMGDTDGYVKGTFRVTSAGVFNLRNGKMTEKITIDGSFAVKRLF